MFWGLFGARVAMTLKLWWRIPRGFVFIALTLTTRFAHAIIDGSPSKAEDDAVVLIHSREDGSTCSGTMVAPNVVVTALHCVAENGLWADETHPVFACTPEGDLAADPFGAGTVGDPFPPESLEIYRGEYIGNFPVTSGVHVVSSRSQTLCTNAIAFVVLKDALTTPVVPIRVKASTQAGDQHTLIGYGRSDAEASNWKGRPRLRLDFQPTLDVGPASRDENPTDARPRTLIFQSPSACFGDSGGPALATDTGALVGVFSQLEKQDCLDPENRAHYSHLPEYGQLVLEVEEYVGFHLWREGEEYPYSDWAALEKSPHAKQRHGCHWHPGTPSRANFAMLILAAILLVRSSGRRSKHECTPL